MLAYGAVALAVVAWGGSFVAARLLLHPEGDRVPLSPTALALFRFAIASAFFLAPLITALVRRTVSARDMLRMTILGQIAFPLYFWLQYTGVRETDAGLASILVVGLIPGATALLSRLTGQERIPFAVVAGLVLGFAGVAVMALQKPPSTAKAGFVFGALCLVADAFAFAVYSVLSKRWVKNVAPLTLTAGTMVAGTAGLLAISFASPSVRWSDLSRLDAGRWTALLYLSLVCSIAAYFAYNWALSKLEATRVAVAIYAEPLVAVALGAFLLGERPTEMTLAGSIAIALSVVVVSRSARPGPNAVSDQ